MAAGQVVGEQRAAPRVCGWNPCCGVFSMVTIASSRTTPLCSSIFHLVLMIFQTNSARALASLALRPAASTGGWSRGRTPPTTTPTGSSMSLETMAGATDAESSTSRATFLDNDGEWITGSSCHAAAADANNSISSTSNSSSSKLHLERLSLQQLRQQAQQRGQTSTGSKKQLVERLFCQEPPGKGG